MGYVAGTIKEGLTKDIFFGRSRDAKRLGAYSVEELVERYIYIYIDILGTIHSQDGNKEIQCFLKCSPEKLLK